MIDKCNNYFCLKKLETTVMKVAQYNKKIQRIQKKNHAKKTCQEMSRTLFHFFFFIILR